MRTSIAAGLTALGLAAALAASAAAAPGPAPRLAPGVTPAPTGYGPVTGKWVVANPTPIFPDLNETGKALGQTGPIGAPVDALAKVNGWDWLLVGKDGVGIGYVPMALLKPAGA